MTSWLGSIGVGVVVGVLGLLIGGWLATRAVDWYNVPSREGGSGYFVILLALLALLVGLAIGVGASRVVGGGGTQLKALLFGGGAHLVLLAVVGTVARLMADVAPTFEGEELTLAVEVSWPEAAAPSLPGGDVLPYIGLTALSGNTARVGQEGPLWVEDARREDGRLVVPGAVEIFTSRGKRLLIVNTGTKDKGEGLLLPLPAYPGKAEREWSVWMPRARDGAPPLPDGIRYRFRVVKRNEPIRTQQVGPFGISTLARSFGESRGAPPTSDYVAEAEFQLSYRGAPVTVEGRAIDEYIPDPWKPDEALPSADAVVRYDRIKAVATIPGAEPALVVEVEREDAQYRSSYYYLLQPTGDRLQTTFVSAGGSSRMARRLSRPPADAPPEPARTREGYIDDRILALPGLYLFPRAVLDTRARTVQALPMEQGTDVIHQIAPLSLSPDEKHFARLIRTSDQDGMLIEQVTIADNARRTVPTGIAVTSTGDWQDADRAFFDNYFAWEQTGGSYHVVPRADATALARRGRLREQGSYREYRVGPALPSLRDAFIAELAATFGAVEVPTAADAFAREVRIDGEIFNLSYNDDGEVGVWMENHTNTLPMVKLSLHLDSLLATRRLDAHFKKPESPR